MDEKLRKKALRSQIGAYSWALVIYYLLMNACVAAAAVVETMGRMISGLISGGGVTISAEDLASIVSGGWGYLFACVLGVVLILLWKGMPFFRGMWKTGGKMKPGAFFGLLCVFISGQFLFKLIALLQEWILGFFGLSILDAMAQATASVDSFSMFLYMGLFAPVVEEIVFRGLILRGLERYGKHFAILVSAILFGLFHGNLCQGPYAFAVGLVLGYTAMEYNILWAMVLHMVNNLVLGDTLVRLTMWMGEIFSTITIEGVILLCTVTALVILVCKRERIAAWLREESMDREAWWAFCTAPGTIVLFVMMTVSAFSMLLL